jgi:hypothetical protein
MGKSIEEILPKRSTNGQYIYVKKYSTSLAIKEMQIKTTLRFHIVPQSEWQSLRNKQEMLVSV